MLSWRTIEKDKFERLAEGLIFKVVEKETPTWVTDALDGRGGDGGIDIDVRESRGGRVVRIYQLKWFPEGFSGGYRNTRRAQIRSSFKAAQAHAPDEWVLVVPAKLTPQERRFVEGLGAGVRTSVEILDATRLDDLCAEFPLLAEWADRDARGTALAQLGRESATLAKSGDVAQAVEDLQRRIDSRSQYWSVDIETRAGQIIQTLVAKRHDAAEKEPLSISMTVSLDKADPLRAQLQDAFDYGFMEPLTIESSALVRWEQHGPDWFAATSAGGSVTLGPTPIPAALAETEFTLVLLDDAGRILQRARASDHTSSLGSAGARLILRFAGGIELGFKSVGPGHGPSKIDLTASFGGLNATDVARGLKLVLALKAAASIKVQIQEGVLMAGNLGLDPDAGGWLLGPELRETVDDLCRVQDLCNSELAFDTRMAQPQARRLLRIARLVLEGKAAIIPGTQTFEITGTGAGENTGVSQLLKQTGVMKVEAPDYDLPLFDQSIPLGDACFYLGEVEPQDPQTLAAHIAQNPEGTWKATVKIKRDDLGVVLFSPSRYPKDGILQPDPWALTGIDEHPRFTESPPTDLN